MVSAIRYGDSVPLWLHPVFSTDGVIHWKVIPELTERYHNYLMCSSSFPKANRLLHVTAIETQVMNEILYSHTIYLQPRLKPQLTVSQ